MTAELSYQFGSGIFTIPEVSKILKLPYNKVQYWLSRYWDGYLSKVYNRQYTWKVENTKALDFQTMVEFYIVYQFLEAGVSMRKIIKAHTELTKTFKILHPFSHKNTLIKLSTDGYKIYLDYENGVFITLDGTKQLNLDLIRVFLKNLEFNDELSASKFWPAGKGSSIVVDPHRHFGRPLVGNTNILPETLYSFYKAGETQEFIASIYEIDQKLVADAIKYCEAA